MSTYLLQNITSAPKSWRKATSLKSLVIIVKTIFNTTTYFSAEVVINGKYVLTLDFQSGGCRSAYDQAAIDALYCLGMIDFTRANWVELEGRGIMKHIVVSECRTECEVRQFGKGGL